MGGSTNPTASALGIITRARADEAFLQHLLVRLQSISNAAYNAANAKCGGLEAHVPQGTWDTVPIAHAATRVALTRWEQVFSLWLFALGYDELELDPLLQAGSSSKLAPTPCVITDSTAWASAHGAESGVNLKILSSNVNCASNCCTPAYGNGVVNYNCMVARLGVAVDDHAFHSTAGNLCVTSNLHAAAYAVGAIVRHWAPSVLPGFGCTYDASTSSMVAAFATQLRATTTSAGTAEFSLAFTEGDTLFGDSQMQGTGTWTGWNAATGDVGTFAPGDVAPSGTPVVNAGQIIAAFAAAGNALATAWTATCSCPTVLGGVKGAGDAASTTMCSGHGLCVVNQAALAPSSVFANGLCSCFKGSAYDGPACNSAANVRCPLGDNGQVCGGAAQGSCVKGTVVGCECQPGWTGVSCSIPECGAHLESKVCSGNGTCRFGVCGCDSGFSGVYCQLSGKQYDWPSSSSAAAGSGVQHWPAPPVVGTSATSGSSSGSSSSSDSSSSSATLIIVLAVVGAVLFVGGSVLTYVVAHHLVYKKAPAEAARSLAPMSAAPSPAAQPNTAP